MVVKGILILILSLHIGAGKRRVIDPAVSEDNLTYREVLPGLLCTRAPGRRSRYGGEGSGHRAD